MAGVSYLIRVLPLTLIRKPIKNQFIQSFLYYVPYVTLAVMTFPAILSATNSTVSAALALVVLEAMKMENNIDSDRAGVVKSIKVNRGDSVLEGDVLITLG